ncbi:hypothetical protein SLEP1_g12291 [Rubroshorea leprosula]|uniref:Uncharacterized protein n=1 Tax=Rubroshorea leprosula TaxID=152421 RepID=A0AAV5IMR7_9ROSI|nr:hypothetical protein SLEP1_g12291 [Rubroshorea leprosula]
MAEKPVALRKLDLKGFRSILFLRRYVKFFPFFFNTFIFLL